MPKTHMITELSYARLIFIFSTNTCYCLLRALNAVLITCLRYSTKDSLIERNLSWIEQSTLYKDNFCPCSLRRFYLSAFLKQNPILYKVVLISEFLNEIPRCSHSNESYWEVFLCGAVYYAVQGGSNCVRNTEVRQFRWKLLNSNFLWYCLLCCARIFKLMILWMKKAWQFKRDFFSRAILLCCI